MKGKLKFLLFYFFFFFAFFQFARLAFLLYNFSNTRTLSLRTIMLSFFYGMRMDLSVCSYIILPVLLFAIASTWLKFFRRAVVYLVYSYSLIILLILLVLTDLQVYRSWGFRIDTTPLNYLDSPKEVWASISNQPLIWIITAFIVLCISVCAMIRRLIKKKSYLLHENERPVLQTGILIVLAMSMIIPIRGGLQLSPMNQSTVYFSENNFANLAAINAPWNFLYAIVQRKPTTNPYLYLDDDISMDLCTDLISSSEPVPYIINDSRPNIILIIWESFTQKATETLIDGKEVTPHFNQLKKEGIYFDHIYASGDRTDKGLAAILAGYPALNKFSIIRYPSRSAKLFTFPKRVKELGYSNRFYYGGETEFANIKSFLLQNDFDDIIDKNSFAKKDQNSKWGAHDGIVAGKILADAANFTTPFFTTWLTLSSHEPFETPVPSVFPGADDTREFANSLHYADESVYAFVEGCKKMPWWQNTLLVIIADHGHPLLQPSNSIDNFRIPMLWLGGALNNKTMMVHGIGSQIDLATTLSTQLRAPYNYIFGKDLLQAPPHEWAYYSFNDGFGFIQPQSQYVFDNVGRQVINQRGAPPTVRDLQLGQALQQQIFQHYLEKKTATSSRRKIIEIPRVKDEDVEKFYDSITRNKR